MAEFIPPFAPSNRFVDYQKFLSATNTKLTVANTFQQSHDGIWVRPPWGMMTRIVFCGSGGGGGGGAGGAAASNRGGGGGGGPPFGWILDIPTQWLPPQLVIVLGKGGEGGAGGSSSSGTAGAQGGASGLFVPCFDSNNGQLETITGSSGGGGGVTSGGNAGGGSQGSGGGHNFLQAIGNSRQWAQSATGATGSGTGSGTAGGSTSNSPIYGGSGGAGISTLNATGNGGGVPTNFPYPPGVFRSGGQAGGQLNGDDQYIDWGLTMPLIFPPPGGGAGNLAGTGGNGGSARAGTGGAGGGGGTSVGGNGGRGGDSFAFFWTW